MPPIHMIVVNQRVDGDRMGMNGCEQVEVHRGRWYISDTGSRRIPGSGLTGIQIGRYPSELEEYTGCVAAISVNVEITISNYQRSRSV